LIVIGSIVVGAATFALGGTVARADIPPPDACTSPGQPCQVAGPNYDQAGVCRESTCTKGLPNGDGGITTMSYACNRCQLGAGGGGGAGGAGGSSGVGGAAGAGAAAGASGAGTGGAPVDPGKKSSGCAVAGGGDRADVAALAGLALLLARRRRRRTMAG